MSTDKLYVVIKRGLFWRPEDKGYTAKIEEAGRYTKEEAESRCHGGEQPVTMALASSFQTQESLQAEVDALRLALAAAQDEAEKAKDLLECSEIALAGELLESARLRVAHRAVRDQLTRSLLSNKDTAPMLSAAESRNATLAAECEKFRDHLTFILPMAKGYAHEHPVGNNQKMVDEAAAALHPATKEGKAE